MKITDTNYDISRNRLTSWVWALAIAFALPVIAYVLFWKVEKLKITDLDERIEMAVLIACGEAAFVVDIFIDVWMYALLGGMVGNLILHGIVLGGYALVCIWKNYGLKWLWPGILEFGFILGMNATDNVTYQPYLVSFMGLYISWLLMVIASGYKTQETSSKMANLVSKFI